MAKEVMRRKATDNEYLHKDFHGALSCGIEYLHERYGEEAVRQYLRDFTLSFYAPLREELKTRGLTALREYFLNMYRAESASAVFEMSEDELIVTVNACPAITHMREHGYPVARLFHETTRLVNETLCEDTPYAAEFIGYDPTTGRSIQRFFRRAGPPASNADRQTGASCCPVIAG